MRNWHLSSLTSLTMQQIMTYCHVEHPLNKDINIFQLKARKCPCMFSFVQVIVISGRIQSQATGPVSKSYEDVSLLIQEASSSQKRKLSYAGPEHQSPEWNPASYHTLLIPLVSLSFFILHLGSCPFGAVWVVTIMLCTCTLAYSNKHKNFFILHKESLHAWCMLPCNI